MKTLSEQVLSGIKNINTKSVNTNKNKFVSENNSNFLVNAFDEKGKFITFKTFDTNSQAIQFADDYPKFKIFKRGNMGVVEIETYGFNEDNSIEGTLKTFANNYQLVFKNNKYYFVDNYGNDRYITNYNNKEKVFNFIKKYDHDINFADNITDIEKLINQSFKR